MKQILQDLSTGRTELIEAPSPTLRPGHVLIDTTVSLISIGTERMLVEFGRANLFSKARQQPERVRQVLAKIATDGLLTTLQAVRSKLESPIPLGYCNVGVVRESDDPRFRPGVRVVSNSPHADVVCAPGNLCAVVPDGVSDEAAAFTVVASIGLQGIRLANPSLGEAVVVIGAGLIGLLTIQLLRAQGCRVLAIDLDETKLGLARRFGAETCNLARGEDPVAAGLAFGRGVGVDAVIVTASTKSSDPITQAARMSRKRGRIVLVGVTGLELNRGDFYEKELTFQVSCSYGPGRYDPDYEQKGHDYPIGFVRWTEQRNFEAVLDTLAMGGLNVEPLITHRFRFDEAPKAYELLAADRSALGILLDYDHDVETRHTRQVGLSTSPQTSPSDLGSKPVVGFIGAGNYASRMAIPAFRAAGARLHTIVSAGGTNASVHGRRSGFERAGSDAARLIADAEINTVVVATRHNTHARFVEQALRAGKSVFVEKPLAIRAEEVDRLEEVFREVCAGGRSPYLMVGFNRRFSPHVQKMKELLASVREPKCFVMTMNAGAIPKDHWTQDPEVGGGRIVGEACHFVDLMRFLAGSRIVSVQARRVGDHPGLEVLEDKATILLGFEDGSMGAIHYFANGSPRFPKERIEVFAAGRVLQLDNFRSLKAYGWPGFSAMRLWRQDKGHNQCAAAFLKSVESGGPPPIPPEEIFEVARATLTAADLLRAQ